MNRKSFLVGLLARWFLRRNVHPYEQVAQERANEPTEGRRTPPWLLLKTGRGESRRGPRAEEADDQDSRQNDPRLVFWLDQGGDASPRILDEVEAEADGTL